MSSEHNKEYSVFKPKKTKYRLFWIWLVVFLTITFFNWFIRGDFIPSDTEGLFYKVLSLGFPVLIGYYLWREFSDRTHSEKISEKEMQKEVEKT